MLSMNATTLYGAQPDPTPTAVPSREQIAASGRRSSRPRQDDPPAESASGDRAVLLLVVLIGVAIALGWVSVSGAVRIGG